MKAACGPRIPKKAHTIPVRSSELWKSDVPQPQLITRSLLTYAVTGNRYTILVGEDELKLRAYLDMALKCLGSSVESAEDGEEV
jgi:hypothetical protein